MTVLQALAILEAAVLESKKRDINTPEVREALGFGFFAAAHPSHVVDSAVPP